MGGAAGAGGRGGGRRPVGPSLAELLTPDVILPAMSAEGVLDRLAQYLPEAHRTRSALADLVNSPQFKGQLETLTRALSSGQMDLGQFGLTNAAGFSVGDFLQAIDAAAAAEAAEAEAAEAAQRGAGAGAAEGGEKAAPQPQ